MAGVARWGARGCVFVADRSVEAAAWAIAVASGFGGLHRGRALGDVLSGHQGEQCVGGVGHAGFSTPVRGAGGTRGASATGGLAGDRTGARDFCGADADHFCSVWGLNRGSSRRQSLCRGGLGAGFGISRCRFQHLEFCAGSGA